VERWPTHNPLASFIRTQMRLGSERLRDRLLSWLLDRLLPNLGASGVLVTQDERPALVVLSMIPPAVVVRDATSGHMIREISEPGIAGGMLIAP
jgi:hypothetical protein